MRKTLILIVIVLILVIIAICVARRRPNSCCSTSAPLTRRDIIQGDTSRSNVNYKGVKLDDFNKPLAKVNMILNAESKLLSYAIVLKNLEHEVEAVNFVVDGKEVYQASGPRDPKQEGEIVVHGLWREKSRVPITSAYIADLSSGRMSAVVRFKDQNIAPFTVEMLPK